MEVVSSILLIIGEVLWQLLTQPLYYIFVIGTLLHYRRQGILERRLYHIRLYPYAGRVLRTAAAGLIAGVCLSAAMTGIGIHMTYGLVWVIGGLTIVLSLVRIRLAHILDVLALLSILYVVVLFFPSWQLSGWAAPLLDSVRQADWVGLFALAVLLQIAETILFRIQAARLSSPVNMAGKRGKPVGAHTLNVFWPVPLWLFVPAAGGWMLPWNPLHNASVWEAGAAMTLLPVMLGSSLLTQSQLSAEKVLQVTRRMWMSNIILLIIAAASFWWAPLAVIGIWTAVIWREYIVYKSRREEAESIPMYVEGLRGLRILDVIPGSPADELGITAGETVYKVNGMLVHDPQSLHQGLRMNPAFCKLEILNIAGENKFLQRAIYAGDHHQLGMIFVPNDHSPASLEVDRLAAWHLLIAPRTVSTQGQQQLDRAEKETANEQAEAEPNVQASSALEPESEETLSRRSRSKNRTKSNL